MFTAQKRRQLHLFFRGNAANINRVLSVRLQFHYANKPLFRTPRDVLGAPLAPDIKSVLRLLIIAMDNLTPSFILPTAKAVSHQ